MRVLIKEPGLSPRIQEIDGSLSSLQRLVGGRIEHLGITSRCGMLVDEEGRLKGKDYNFTLNSRHSIVGTAVFIGEAGEEFTDINESDEYVLRYLFTGREVHADDPIDEL